MLVEDANKCKASLRRGGALSKGPAALFLFQEAEDEDEGEGEGAGKGGGGESGEGEGGDPLHPVVIFYHYSFIFVNCKRGINSSTSIYRAVIAVSSSLGRVDGFCS